MSSEKHLSKRTIDSLSSVLVFMKSTVRFGLKANICFGLFSFLFSGLVAFFIKVVPDFKKWEITTNTSITTVITIIHLFIFLYFYVKTIRRNKDLKNKMEGISGIKSINEIWKPYKSALFFLKLIRFIDITIIFWGVSTILKIIFWFKYRKIGRVSKRYRD